MILNCPKYVDLHHFSVNKMANVFPAICPDILSKNMIIEITAFTFLVIYPSWFRVNNGSMGKGLPNILHKLLNSSTTFTPDI